MPPSSPQPAESYTDVVRKLLSAAFNSQEISTLCFDYFPEVYEEFGSGMGKGQMIHLLVEHCTRRDRMGELVEQVRQRNPAQYGRFQEQLERSATPSVPPATEPTRHVGAPDGEEGESVGPVRQRWALLVGVNRYVDPAIPALRFCVNDVRALETQLTGLGYTVVALHDEAAEERLRPTRDNVEAELVRLCEAAGQDDLLLVHFSGHGKLVGGKPVLLTQESRLATADRRALTVGEVEALLQGSAARRSILFLDACHSGVAMDRDIPDPAFVSHVYEQAQGFALLAATSKEAVALEWNAGQHGAFTYFLLEGLTGKADRANKGFVSFRDLEAHVLDALRPWSVQHGGLVQAPTTRSEIRGDPILADFRVPTL